MSGGLLFRGREIPVPGLTVWNPKNAKWATLSPRDYRPRKTTWIRQVILHTTKGAWPQVIVPGKGPMDREELVARFWQDDPVQSAAHIVIGSDGEVSCLADLATICAYHATWSNDWSVGIEIYQEAKGVIYEAALKSALVVVPLLCNLLEMPLQIPSRRYPNAPITRMIHGGPDMVGVFGHRDNTGDRGRGDPGDEVFTRLRAAGADAWDYDRGEDKVRCAAVQRYLNTVYKAGLVDDGECGPETFRAMRARGYSRVSQVPA